MKLESYVSGAWRAGSGDGRPFFNPVTGEELGRVDATGIDCAAALAYARDTGGPALRALSFAERGALLRSISEALGAKRERYGEIARLNSGNTAGDAAIDIDGGIGTLRFFARIGQGLGDAHTLIEPGTDQLARDPVFFARHLWTSRHGVAVHVNAFNFPSWGLWEKVAASLLAGVPAVAKPASATAWLSAEMVRDVIDAGILPDGALSLVCGAGDGLIEALGPMDALAFTGSSETGARLRSHPNILANAPRVTIEADSINATILGPDATAGSAVFDLAVREARSALTVKAGQLCTNIRRILVPAAAMSEFEGAVAAQLEKTTVGDPADETVRMGPLADATQRDAALAGLATLARETTAVIGGGAPESVVGADAAKGAFVAPTLLRCDTPEDAEEVHRTEVFGPVATVMPYEAPEAAARLAARGGGSLAASIFSDDGAFAGSTAAEIAASHGRVLVVDEAVGRNHTGHAIVMPQCVHGGPGRAGGGEELGGIRGLRLYMQRTAVQGSEALLARLAEDAAEASL